MFQIASGLLQVFRDPQGSVDKRIAAYLVLMKSPSRATLQDLILSLTDMEHLYPERYLISFIISHLNNILDSTDPELEE